MDGGVGYLCCPLQSKRKNRIYCFPRALPASTGCRIAAPVVGIVHRCQKFLVIATVRHSRIEVARPLPVFRHHFIIWFISIDSIFKSTWMESSDRSNPETLLWPAHVSGWQELFGSYDRYRPYPSWQSRPCRCCPSAPCFVHSYKVQKTNESRGWLHDVRPIYFHQKGKPSTLIKIALVNSIKV